MGAVPRRVDDLPAGSASSAAGGDRREPRGRRAAAGYGLEAGRLQSAGLRGQRFRVGAAASQSALSPAVGNGHRGVATRHGQRALDFPQPTFVPLPPDWEKCIGRNTALVGAFHKHKPGLLQAYPKDRAKTSGPWPSIRSWTNAALCAAAMEAIDAEPLLRYRAVAGCVGEEAALEFQTWEQSLDLPDPEVWLAQAETARAGATALALDIPPRCDQVMAVLAALVDRVKNHNLGPNGKPTEGRWLAAVDCFAEVAKCWLEPAIAAAGPLYFAVPHASVLVKAPTDFSNTVLQVHKNIMAAA